MTDQNPPEESVEEIQSDEVVGAALRWSAAIVVLLAVCAALVWIVLRPPATAPATVAGPTALPTTREVPKVEIPKIPYTEITQSAGILFQHENGAEGEKLLPETMGGGGAFFDFDNDGDQDLLCVNSCAWPWSGDREATGSHSALYANDGTGRFTDVTAGSGLDVAGYSNGVACGDIDQDGDTDVFITGVGLNNLFRNDGAGHFTEMAAAAGVAGHAAQWSTGAGFFDYDRDRDLDLLVCNYIEWTRELDQSMNFTLDGKLRAYGRPTDFRGAFPYLYRNDGGGTFTDVSVEAGVQAKDPNTGVPLCKSLGVVFPDVNEDGWPDIVIANDTVQNLLFLNQENGSFQESAAISGVAFDTSGAARGAMGIDFGLFRNSRALGIAIGNFATEMTALYVCQSPGMPVPMFRDEAIANGIGPVTRTDLKFGVLFLDADLDGRLDLFENNGHLEEDIKVVQASQQYEQSPHLLWNCGPEHETEFVMLPESSVGADFKKRMVGRGATMADIDADGDLDLMLFSSGGVPRLLRNDQQNGNHWLRIKLHGTQSNREAIGAEVIVTLADGTAMQRTVSPTRSYLSQVELPVTFGLGPDAVVRDVTIKWPAGGEQTVTSPAVDQLLEVQEPETPAVPPVTAAVK
jgi:hypothetical protein